MKLLGRTASEAQIQFSRSELILLNNALNEVLHGIEIPEFATRLGATREEAQGLLGGIALAIHPNRKRTGIE